MTKQTLIMTSHRNRRHGRTEGRGEQVLHPPLHLHIRVSRRVFPPKQRQGAGAGAVPRQQRRGALHVVQSMICFGHFLVF